MKPSSSQPRTGSAILQSGDRAGGKSGRTAPVVGAAGPQRTIISLSPVLNIVREHDPAAHESPDRRGGYLRMAPGEVPTIVLDGLASEAEQLDAELRCRRELNLILAEREQRNEGQAETAVLKRRRELLHYSAEVVVSRETEPEHHEDPRRRGGYLRAAPGRIPEIVLDGLASEEEQAAALARLLRSLDLSREHASLRLLPQLLQPAGQGRAPTPLPSSTPPLAPRQDEARRPRRLGERLLAEGLLSHEDLAATLQRQRQLHESGDDWRLGSLLVAAHKVSAPQVARVLAAQRGVRPTASERTRVDAPLRGIFPVELLLELQAAPLFQSGRLVAVAMCDPQDQRAVAALQEKTALRIEPMQATQLQVEQFLRSLNPPPPVLSSGASVPPSPSARSLAAELGLPSRVSQPRLSPIAGVPSRGSLAPPAASPGAARPAATPTASRPPAPRAPTTELPKGSSGAVPLGRLALTSVPADKPRGR